MAVEAATTINQLDQTKPGINDLKSEGDDHIRLLKSTIKATFPNITGPVTATHADLNKIAGAAAGAVAGFNVATQPAADNTTLAASTAMVQSAILSASGITAALPGQAGNAGKVLGTDGTNASWLPISKTVEVLTSGATWTCPAGVSRVTVHVQGGGGGGGRSSVNPACGGGAGGYARLTFTAVPATAYTISIGAGGTGATVANTPGSAGSSTTFNTGAVVVTGFGGSGGTQSTAFVAIGGAASNGDINIRGGYGTSYSGNASPSLGGDSQFGSGGSSAEPSDASGFGSGGCGSVGVNAGNGAPGCIVLEY